MDFTGLFEIRGMPFSIMILGFSLEKKGVIKGQSQELLTDLMVYVALPYNIVRSSEIEFDHEILVNCLIILIVALGIQVSSYILSLILYPHMGKRRKRVPQYATIYSNARTLGDPMAESIFGLPGLPYASIYLIFQQIFMWLAGLTYFTEALDKKTLVKKVMTHPCILTVGLGLALMVSDIRLPSVAKQTVKTLASINTTPSILFIGSILAGAGFRSLWNHVTLYYSLIRLAFIPCLICLFCLVFHVEPAVTGVSTVLAGMSAVSVTVILAAKYKYDAVFAAKYVVLSTLLSMVTISALCLTVR